MNYIPSELFESKDSVSYSLTELPLITNDGGHLDRQGLPEQYPALTYRDGRSLGTNFFYTGGKYKLPVSLYVNGRWEYEWDEIANETKQVFKVWANACGATVCTSWGFTEAEALHYLYVKLNAMMAVFGLPEATING